MYFRKTLVVLSTTALIFTSGAVSSFGDTKMSLKNSPTVSVELSTQLKRDSRALQSAWNNDSTPDFDTVLNKIKKDAPTWSGKTWGDKYRDAIFKEAKTQDGSIGWCAWTASYFLRGKHFAGGKEIFNPSTSGFLKDVALNTSGGKARIIGRFETSKKNEGKGIGDAKIIYAPDNKTLQGFLTTTKKRSDGKLPPFTSLQPGDLLGYYEIAESASVTKLLEKPSASSDKPFTHLGTVTEPNKFVEGNRGYKVRTFTTANAEFKYYGGLVIIRPDWK